MDADFGKMRGDVCCVSFWSIVCMSNLSEVVARGGGDHSLSSRTPCADKVCYPYIICHR